MKVQTLFLSIFYYLLIMILMFFSIVWKKEIDFNIKDYFKELIETKNIFGIIYSVAIGILALPITIIVLLKGGRNKCLMKKA